MHIIKRGKKYFSLFFILVFLCFVSFASANDIQKSSKGINYDKEILEKLDKENNTFIEVIIEFEDKSKLNQVTSDVLNEKSNYFYGEIKEFEEWDYSNRIDAQVTKKGFEKLLNDSRVKSIYYDFPVQSALSDSAHIIGATSVWNNLSYTGDGIDICVIDTGVDRNHPDLNGKVVAEYCYCDELFGGCCPDGTNEDNNASDDNGHGTHVSGIVASQDSTYKGIAYGSDIYAVKVLNENGKGKISDIGKAIDWCVNQDVDVISISIGDGENHPGDSNCPETINEQIENASEDDIVVVVSSGNEDYSNGISYPACNDNVLSVGATDKQDNLASYPNRWANLSLLAPGGEWSQYPQYSEIVSTFSTIVQEDEDLCFLEVGSYCIWGWCLQNTCYDTNFSVGSDYIRASGTSMSAPIVAGAAALLLEANSSLEPDDILDLLQDTGVPVFDATTGLTFPRIDVEAALDEMCDRDNDGYYNEDCSGGDDCDDSDGGTHPSTTEYCDLIDNDCDSIIDEGCSGSEPPEGELYDCEEEGYEQCIGYEIDDCDAELAINDYSENYIRWGQVVDGSDPYVIGNYTVGWKGLGVEDVYYDVDDPNSDCDYDSGGCDTGDDIDNTGTMVVINAPGIADRELILAYDKETNYSCWVWWNSYSPNYGANNPIYVLNCYDDGDCSSNQYCDKSGVWNTWDCVSKLSDGQSCSSDSVCLSGYCDNDGIGLSDDGWCFTPYNNYFDGQETSYCEVSTGNGNYICDERSIGDDLGLCSGVAFYEEECSSTCGYDDITSVFECSDSGCSCSEPLCDGLTIGDNITTCSAEETYFADECTSSAEGRDRGDNICRSSVFASGCSADSECNGVEAGTGNCNIFCKYNDESPTNSTIIYPNGGEELNKSIIIDWTQSSDPDGDFVTYFLQYSNDSGTNWFNIISNYGFENKLNDSSTEKELAFSGDETQTVYLRIPKNATITYAKLNLEGDLNE